jgi:outer membrane protein OmpA-like peptidoglycan-associated protein
MLHLNLRINNQPTKTMKRRYLSFLTACALLLAFSSDAFAQMDVDPDDKRAVGTFYLMPKGGFTNYLGDRDLTPFDFEDWRANIIPYTAGLEAGYQLTQGFSLSSAYVVGEYPSIRFNDHGIQRGGFNFGTSDDGTVDDFDNQDANGDEFAERYDDNFYTRRHTAQLIFRYLFTNDWTVAPFIETGLHGSVGFTDFDSNDDGDPNATQDDEDLIAFGPIGGLGLDWAVSDQFSVVLEAVGNLTVPDEAIDGVQEEQLSNDSRDRFSRFDVISQVNLGLKYSFQERFVPVRVMSLDCPSELEVGEEATFTSTVNDNVATPPLSYDWDFDDGTMGDGLLASHSFDEAGTYTVEFTASNDGSTRTETCAVNVVEPSAPAQITLLNADPRSFQVCEPTEVEFTTDVEGENVEYDWDFGNGETSSDQEPQVTYSQPGTYTVTLRVSNDVGSDTRTVTIRARECDRVPDICDEVTELNPVFFDQNSSQLSSEARSALRENIEILEQCPNICARIEAFAGPAERNPEDLSQARADAVAEFYEDNGIDSDDLRPVGLGQVGGTTSKKQGTSQFRRADSIPLDCEDLGDMDEDEMGMDDDDGM